MQQTRSGKRRERGFTLVEVIMVTAIIGILAAIALPQLVQFKGQVYCGRVQSDAGNAVTAMEAYYAGNLAYGTLVDAGFTPSGGVTVKIANTDPLAVQATDDTGSCPRGNTFTLSQGYGMWS